MRVVNIICNRPIKRGLNVQPVSFGCGWSDVIEKAEQVPANCPNCHSKDLRVEDSQEWHRISRMWARKNGWNSKASDNLPQFLIRGHLDAYFQWKKGLQDYSSVKIPARFTQAPPGENGLIAFYLRSHGLSFGSRMHLQRFFKDYPPIEELARGFVNFYYSKAAAAA